MEESLALQLLSVSNEPLSLKTCLICDRLAQMLISRVKEIEHFLLPDVDERIRQSISYYDLYSNIGCSETLSFMQKRASSDQSWNHATTDIYESCDLSSWKQAGFTYDIEDYYYIAQALTISSIDMLTEEIFEEILELHFMEEYFSSIAYTAEDAEELRLSYIEQLLDTATTISLATETGATECPFLDGFAKEIAKIIFDDLLSKSTVLHNLPEILVMMFGLTGYDRSIAIIFSHWAGVFLTYKEFIPDGTEKELVEKAVDFILNPFQNADSSGFFDIPCLHQFNDTGLSTVIFLGNYHDDDYSASLFHFHPMLELAVEVIDQYIPRMVAPFIKATD